jgi:tetratricopeptide (TPR) repeat protein
MAKNKVKLIIAIVCIIGIALLAWSMASTLAKQDYNALGLAQYEAGNYDKAIEYFTKTIESDSNNAMAYFNRGFAHFRTGSYMNKEPYNKAVADFNKAIELSPSYIDAYYNRGLAYENIEGNKYYMSDGLYKALMDHEKALELDPMYIMAHAGKGNICMRASEYDRAVFEYNKALDSENLILQKVGKEGLAGVYASRARNYRYLEKCTLSIADYNRAMELDPTLTTALAHQIANYKDVGEWNRVIELCNMMIELKKDDPTYNLSSKYGYKGLAYYNLGKYDKAIFNYNKAIELNSTDVVFYRGLSAVYREIEEGEKAKQAFESAIELDTRTIEKGTYKKMDRKYYSRGLTYHEMGEYDKAISDYKKAIELNFDRGYFGIGYYVKAYRDLGKAYLEIGENAKAKEAFQTALRLFREENRLYSAEQVQQLLKPL